MNFTKRLGAVACRFMAWLPLPTSIDELPTQAAVMLRRWRPRSPKELTRQDWRDMAAVLEGEALTVERRAELRAKLQ